MEPEITTALNEAEELSKKIGKLLSTDAVKEYLSLKQKFSEYETILREQVVDKGIKIEYFSIEDDSNVSLSPCVKTTFKPDVNEVHERWGDKYLTATVNAKMMKESPECTDYLDSVKKETIYSKKTKIKNLF